MAEFFLELFSEEIPAGLQQRAVANLKEQLSKTFNQENIECSGAVETGATPRRLWVWFEDIASSSKDQQIERRGPRVGAPEKAVQGFRQSLPSKGVEFFEIEEKKGLFMAARYTLPGKPARQILSESLPELLKNFAWPKSMRWGSLDTRWVRPLHKIICLLDQDILPFSIAGIQSGSETLGHRFMAPSAIRIESFSHYRSRLAEQFVLVSPEHRKSIITEEATKLAEMKGLHLRHDPALLDEVTGLVEWPVPLMGRIDENFMELPSEILIASMRGHQKYLAVLDEKDKLAPYFITIANLAAKDGGDAIINGNERVLRARLWDARFFWEQDKKVSAEIRLERLKPMVFHAKLGSLFEKVVRLEELTDYIANKIAGCDTQAASQAGRLAKNDLVSGMVGEFPELQGIMGQYYAKAEGIGAKTASAIGQHYRPQGPQDSCPFEPEAVAVAMADKIDTLCGFFAVGEKPTGSKDPFALRRACLGIIRLITENNLSLDLLALFRKALTCGNYKKLIEDKKVDTTARECWAFTIERFKALQKENDLRHDVVDAALSNNLGHDLSLVKAKSVALNRLISSEDGQNLLQAYKRSRNILVQESKKDGVENFGTEVLLSEMEQNEERALLEKLQETKARLEPLLAAMKFEESMNVLAGLRSTVDAFFEHVMVNSDKPALRLNRLRLLSDLRSSFELIADFSLIET